MIQPIIIDLIRSSCLLLCSLILSMPSVAQVTTDGTTSTRVTNDGNNFESVKVQTDLRETDKEKKEKRKIVTMVESSKPSSINDIIPAQGAIILENGDVLLTAYPTANSDYRSAHSKAKCEIR